MVQIWGTFLRRSKPKVSPPKARFLNLAGIASIYAVPKTNKERH